MWRLTYVGISLLTLIHLFLGYLTICKDSPGCLFTVYILQDKNLIIVSPGFVFNNILNTYKHNTCQNSVHNNICKHTFKIVGTFYFLMLSLSHSISFLSRYYILSMYLALNQIKTFIYEKRSMAQSCLVDLKEMEENGFLTKC